MDIAAAITLAGEAIGIVKKFRDIDKRFDVATIKADMADLYTKVADVKIALSDARDTIHDKDREIRELQGKIAALTSGDACPVCREPGFKVVASQPHRDLGFVGVQMRKLRCDKCGHSEERMTDLPKGNTQEPQIGRYRR